MNLSAACRDLNELGVIDEKVLYNAIIEQGPKGEEGRLFKQEGIIYEEIKYLRLEYLDILKIDHLWIMPGLTKLHLSNNSIEKIENLEALVNLNELDLSFNFITRIENLDAQVKLKVLSLFENKIKTIENLNNLTDLTVFSIGNNEIEDYSNVLYMRSFKKLKSFNMAGNPVCKKENFFNFIAAYLPQLVYYEYRMITKPQKEEAKKMFLSDLFKLERDEEALEQVREAKKEEEELENINSKAFVEYLGGNQLFLSLFEKDSDCKILLQMGESVKDVYNEFEKNFIEVTKELHAFGLKQLEIRQSEIERFEKYTGGAKEKAFEASRTIVEDLLRQKNLVFDQIKEMINTEAEDEENANEVSFNLQLLKESFLNSCQATWNLLMKKELNLFEATEEINGTYDRTLTEMVNQFIEGAQGYFTQLRQLQSTFSEAITDVANKFFTNYTVSVATRSGNDYKNLPKDLIYMMKDKELLLNALSTSHDYHLLIIDQREDKLVSKIKSWLSNVLENLYRSEINRNRDTVTEINHFLDTQKFELQEMLSTPVALLFLPKAIQDALQIFSPEIKDIELRSERLKEVMNLLIRDSRLTENGRNKVHIKCILPQRKPIF